MHEMKQYMKEQGPALFDAGFKIIPIVPNKKNPSVDNWRDLEVTEELVNEWAKKRPGHGVGVRGSSCPALDIDIDHPEAGPEMQSFVEDLIGRGPLRRGQGHKILLPVDTDIHRKMKSTIYTDGKKQHAIELLTDGQQWVAYGFHEGAGRDYIWERGDLESASIMGDIPELTAEQLSLIFTKWDEVALRYGLRSHRKQSRMDCSSAGVGPVIQGPLTDYDEQTRYLAGLKAPMGKTLKEAKELIRWIPADDYDDWIAVGMGLHHEFQGSKDAMNLWGEWSRTSPKYKGLREIERKWGGFHAS